MSRAISGLFVLLTLPVALAQANHTEKRYYSILADGKEVGQSSFAITEQENGVAYVVATSTVKIPGLFTYTFQLDVQEWWQTGKLVGLKSVASENGRKFEVAATQDPGGLRLRSKGAERISQAELWTTSFWRLADAKFHNKQVPLLTVDRGEEHEAQLQYVGAERIPVANVPTACFHFRLSGVGNPIELWFDQHHRLVRQEFSQSGRRMIVQLMSRR